MACNPNTVPFVITEQSGASGHKAETGQARTESKERIKNRGRASLMEGVQVSV